MKIDIHNLNVKECKPYHRHIYEADLLIEGKIICKIRNTNGKPGKVQFVEVRVEQEDVLKKAILFWKKFPTRYIPYNDDLGDGHEIKGSLGALVEDIVIKFNDPMKQTRDKVLVEDLSKKGIVIGFPTEPVETYTCLFMRDVDIQSVLDGGNKLQHFRDFLYHQMNNRWVDGMEVFNKNLTKDDIDDLGIKKYINKSETKSKNETKVKVAKKKPKL